MNTNDFVRKEINKASKTFVKMYFKHPIKNRYLLKLLRNQKRALKKRQQLIKKNQHVPIELILSITKKCNLNCLGCYFAATLNINKTEKKSEMTINEYQKIFEEAKKIGVSIILLAGGEPLLRKDIISLASNYREILFTIFTNGTQLNKEYRQLFIKNKHLMLIFSLEGNRTSTDERRGQGIYDLTMDNLSWAQENNLIFGTSITVTSQNIDHVLEKSFFDNLVKRGCQFINYVEFEDLEENLQYLKLSNEQRKRLENKTSEFAQLKKILVTSFPSFEYGSGGCLAAGRGFFHINPFGDIEPCNFIPYKVGSIINSTILEQVNNKIFIKMRASNILEKNENGICPLIENLSEFKEMLAENSDPN